MARLISLARPYASAVFESAAANAMHPSWSVNLLALKIITQNKLMQAILRNRTLIADNIAGLYFDVCEHLKLNLDNAQQNLIKLLAQYKRLKLLPDIADLYETMKYDSNGEVPVKFSSVEALDANTQEKYMKILAKKWQCKIVPEFLIDESLIAGFIIEASGSRVLDGSMRGQLQKLSADLTL